MKRIENLPRKILEQIDKKIDEGVSLRKISDWLFIRHGISVGDSSLMDYQKMRNARLRELENIRAFGAGMASVGQQDVGALLKNCFYAKILESLLGDNMEELSPYEALKMINELKQVR